MKRNPKKEKIVPPEASGIGAIFDQQYANMSDADRKKLVMKNSGYFYKESVRREEAQSVAIEQHEVLRKRNRTGALGKARNNQTDKQNVRQVYDDLVAQHSKKPTCDLLHNKLIEKYGERKWSGHTIRKWIAKLNKGEDI
ncbi:MAG: hypothetical protein RL274_2044 [Pseudomonadota bacterium]|jgi:hypothetical protein